MDDPIQRHPTRGHQLPLLVSVIAGICGDGARVLDLGCGTGYLGHLIQEKRPDLAFVGVDLKQESLDAAASNLAKFQKPPQLVPGDLREFDRMVLPTSDYAAIVSVLTFHDLDDPAKQRVIARAAKELAPDGFFLLFDRVRLVEPALFPLQQAIWRHIETDYGTAMRSAESFDAYVADLDKTNRPGALEDYFAWFRAAGLEPQLLHLYGNVALIGGARPTR